MTPSCLEYNNDAYIGKWDFTSPIYQTSSADNGLNGYDFSLIDDQTSYDPIYVHNQGLWFDGTSHIRTTTSWTQTHQESFTYEGWVRPEYSTLKGTLLAWEINPNNDDASIYFSGNNIVVKIGNNVKTIPITYTSTNTWHYVGVSFHKLGTNSVRV